MFKTRTIFLLTILFGYSRSSDILRKDDEPATTGHTEADTVAETSLSVQETTQRTIEDDTLYTTGRVYWKLNSEKSRETETDIPETTEVATESGIGTTADPAGEFDNITTDINAIENSTEVGTGPPSSTDDISSDATEQVHEGTMPDTTTAAPTIDAAANGKTRIFTTLAEDWTDYIITTPRSEDWTDYVTTHSDSSIHESVDPHTTTTALRMSTAPKRESGDVSTDGYATEIWTEDVTTSPSSNSDATDKSYNVDVVNTDTTTTSPRKSTAPNLETGNVAMDAHTMDSWVEDVSTSLSPASDVTEQPHETKTTDRISRIVVAAIATQLPVDSTSTTKSSSCKLTNYSILTFVSVIVATTLAGLL